MSDSKSKDSGGDCCEVKPQQLVSMSKDRKIIKADYISGYLTTSSGEIPIVATKMTRQDIFGSWKVRWGIGRSGFVVQPGRFCFAGGVASV